MMGVLGMQTLQQKEGGKVEGGESGVRANVLKAPATGLRKGNVLPGNVQLVRRGSVRPGKVPKAGPKVGRKEFGVRGKVMRMMRMKNHWWLQQLLTE
jgi:hypothetical protein